MTALRALISRNVKLFFRDKGMFFTSLITPLILLVLYTTFLSDVYRDSFIMGIPEGLSLPDKLVDGCVAGQLASSLLAVSCVTVAFCANMLMVQDITTGARRDLTISPVKSSTLAAAYYAAAFISTLIVCLTALGASLIFIAAKGWYLTALDVVQLAGDVVLLTLFGTALSSFINSFLTTQGQISAVGTIVSSGYGFICGAYMPTSQFAEGLRRVISFLPGTYATGLLRDHAMGSALAEFSCHGLPAEAINALRDTLDCNLYFFGNPVSEGAMYAVICTSIAILAAAYIVRCKMKKV